MIIYFERKDIDLDQCLGLYRFNIRQAQKSQYKNWLDYLSVDAIGLLI